MEPAKLTKLVRGELDWIVMKALEKDRNRRYETANGFAADVQRYLNDEPVQACPPSAWYRFRKFARRNKAAFLMASLVSVAILLLMVGLAVSNILIRVERNQKIQALHDKSEALGEKQMALGEKETALRQVQANYIEAKRQKEAAQTSAGCQTSAAGRARTGGVGPPPVLCGTDEPDHASLGSGTSAAHAAVAGEPAAAVRPGRFARLRLVLPVALCRREPVQPARA